MDQVTHLYLHIPFCASRCDYCDFYSTSGREELAPRYVDVLLAEAESQGGLLGELDTLYLGGGTPTLLGAAQLKRLLGGLEAFLAPDAELSVEANPSTVSPGLADDLLDAGVNRVTLGIQSFDGAMRTNLGRAGSGEAAAQAFQTLRDAGFENIGVDMIFGIPGQDIGLLQLDLERMLALEPEHISYYELSYREDGRYHRRWRRQLAELVPQTPDYYEAVVDRLQAAGYRWYETSNFALPGYECRHNRAYWDGEDYLGLGAGAWSTVGGTRWYNRKSLDGYLSASGDWQGIRRREAVEEVQAVRERLILGLRQSGGVSGREVESALNAGETRRLRLHGFLVCEGGRIYLTRHGRLMADEISARLLQE